MSQHIGPRTISATGGSIKRVGNYRIHTFPSELITDGLVFNLDAGDPRSYPGSGTTWTDLSGNGNNGTLTNGPTYSNANGGSIVFDGTNDHILGTLPLITGECTIEAWVKFNGVTNLQTVFTQGQDAVSFSCGLVIQNSQVKFRNTNGDYQFSLPSTLVVGQWYHLVVSSTRLITTGYVNGISNGTTSNVVSSNSIQTYKIGQRPGNSAESLNGNVAIARVYSRALSAAEVAQNYDALKVRYTSYTNTFTPLCAGGSGKVEVLCVAGGGGGGGSTFGNGNGGGGGGAGGLLYNSALVISSGTGIGVTIGAGGTGGLAGGSSTTAVGSNGGNTLFSTLTSVGGGGGAAEGGTGEGGVNHKGNSGGSGGGSSAGGVVGGSSTTGQGNIGGTGGGTAGGGGGGSGSAGSAGGSQGNPAGDGGSGLVYSISGNSSYYAAGGGGGNYNVGAGGNGGSGIGGGGATYNVNGSIGYNAIPNTGSGGGGSNNAGTTARIGQNGSNGIVIVRYPATDYNVELLIVGGGGGGGYCKLSDGGGGGGGAGGLIYYSSYPVSAGTKYSVTVGAGGTGSTVTNGSVNGANGSNSIFGPIIAIGGGGGGSTQNASVLNIGGSGGGAGSDGGNDNGGSGTSGQGNNGGNNNTGNLGAGGGGAGAVGTSVTAGTDVPNGGIGLAYAITGTSTYYAGGGGGGKFAGGSGNAGTGGLGGGGNGGKGAAGSNGTANTGGGGGGGGMVGGITGNAGANGGSGIVIIAYQGPQRGIGGTVNTTSRPGYTLHTFTTTGTDFFIP